MAEEYGIQLKTKVNKLFDNIIEPLFNELISEFNGTNGIESRIVSEQPLMMGIEKYKTILFKYPNDVEHVICVYWISGENRIIAENLRMVTLNRSLSIFDFNQYDLKKTIKVLAGLGRK